MSKSLEFRISTGLKNIIGKELITDDLIAIFELVKNSYDANAGSVDITFKNIIDDLDHTQIIIQDDGDGMSFDDIYNKWLFVGYSEKKESEKELSNIDYREKIGVRRVFAGAKGIGRFSCDRLGSTLVLYSKTIDENIIHKITVDWSRFEEDSTKEFQSIEVDYLEITSLDKCKYVFPKNKGVVLEICEPRAKWDKDKLLKLKQRLQRLINPSHVNVNLDFIVKIISTEYVEDDEKTAESFRKKGQEEMIQQKTVNGIVQNFVFENLEIKTTHLNCQIDDKGKIITKLKDKDVFIYSIEEESEKFDSLHDLNIDLFYLNRNAKSLFTKTMAIRPVRYGSIFLYKNGFKINPYGNEGDDWLKLESRKGQGYARYLSTRDLMGRIEVLGYQPNIQEVSSRDGGVISSTEFELLKDFFIKFALRRLENYVVEAIAWDNPSEKRPEKDENQVRQDSLKLIGSLVGDSEIDEKNVEFNRDLLDIYIDKEVEKAPEVIDSLNELVESLDEDVGTQVSLQLSTVRNAFKTLVTKQSEMEQLIEDAEKRALFLKTSVDENKKGILGLQHQIGLATTTIRNELKNLQNKIIKGEILTDDVLNSFIEKFRLQIHYIDSASMLFTHSKFDLRDDEITDDLILFIKQYVENVYLYYYADEIGDVEVLLHIHPRNATFELEFSPLEIVTIIDNLIHNSLKVNAKRIIINLNKISSDKLEIKFRDTGPGIPDDVIDSIWDFGFSTTGGTGIGLFQVQKLVKENYGDIKVTPNRKSGAEFIITVIK